jgi:DNA-directed RNA polymerase subunit RPC12/RpoP
VKTLSSEFNKPQVLECPSCGATLALPDADTFLCDYCGKRILVPPELRPQKIAQGFITASGSIAEQNRLDWQETTQTNIDRSVLQRKRTKLILVFSIGIAVLLIGILMFIVFLFIPTSSSSSSNQPSEYQIPTTPLPTMVQFGRLAMVFGSEGDQPGQFDDARSIAVDIQGNIFVADYTTGRINKFDPQGNFLQLIQVQSANENNDIYIFGIASDDQENLYVAVDGNILKYNASTGELLLTIPDQWPDIYYDSVIVAPDGNLYSTNGMAGTDDVLILSPQGELLDHWVGNIENVNHDDPRMELVLGVNHSGMVYILSPFGNKVYGYNPDGSYNFNFGEEGERAGQFSLSTGMLSITQQDYLIISDVYRVDLYDAKGAYLDKTLTIDYQTAGGSMYGMTIDALGELYYISSGGKVLKFDMNYP